MIAKSEIYTISVVRRSRVAHCCGVIPVPGFVRSLFLLDSLVQLPADSHQIGEKGPSASIEAMIASFDFESGNLSDSCL
jgi:hypothetical protein